MPRYHLILSLLLFLVSAADTNAQTTRTALFLGNSYTAYNNLPLLVYNAALSAGDSLIFDSNTPGGYTLEAHAANATSQNKIMAGGWDYVVLQGQSQEPVVQTSVFNQGGLALNQMINEYNPCAVPMLYMTWGRENGDATTCDFFPVMCTYESMDDAIKDRYLNLASTLDAEVSPVSVVWRYLRENHPDIDLYAGDGSHPSPAGSYAAACSFYTAIFKKDPTNITYNFSLDPADAATIRNAAKVEVFDALEVWDYKELPQSDFNYSIGSGTNEVNFSPQQPNIVQTYSWNFGDGETSEVHNPIHSYASNGTYNVSLTTTNCDLDGFHTSTTDTIIQFCDHTPSVFVTDATFCESDSLWTQPADEYQWYSGGQPIPETGQFLADHQQYNSSIFSVMTTVEGCSELSIGQSFVPDWSGYYFDSAWGGDPCEGDTALFTVYHINGFLSGDEEIRWYQDGVLLSAMNDEDTLLITEGGEYTVHVVNPESSCPLDTTSATAEFVCETVGIPLRSDEDWKVFPNPASDYISLEMPEGTVPDELLIFSATGALMKSERVLSAQHINVSDLPTGLYFIRLVNQPKAVMRFVKE